MLAKQLVLYLFPDFVHLCSVFAVRRRCLYHFFEGLLINFWDKLGVAEGLEVAAVVEDGSRVSQELLPLGFVEACGQCLGFEVGDA